MTRRCDILCAWSGATTAAASDDAVVVVVVRDDDCCNKPPSEEVVLEEEEKDDMPEVGTCLEDSFGDTTGGTELQVDVDGCEPASLEGVQTLASPEVAVVGCDFGSGSLTFAAECGSSGRV